MRLKSMWSVGASLALLLLVWSAQAQAPQDDGAAQRHPLEDRALAEPAEVLKALPALIRQAQQLADARELALLELARANACRVLADLYCQRQAGHAAAVAARRVPDVRLEARGLILEARAYIAMQDFSQGERTLAEASLLLSSDVHAGMLADIDLGYSSMSHALGKHALALEYADRGLARLRPGEEPGLRIRLLRNRARALIQLNRSIEASEALKLALATRMTTADPKLRAELYLEQARLALKRGDSQTQRRSAEQVIQLAKQLGSSQLAGQGYEALGLFARETGDLRQAQTHLQTAAATLRAQGLTREELRVLRALMIVMFDAKRPGDEREPVVRRYLEIESEVIQADRAQASDDFDARLKYAEQENELLRLEGEAALAQERERTLAASNRVTRLVSFAAIGGLAMLLGFYLVQRRSNRRLRTAMQAVRENESRATALLQLSAGYVFLHDLQGRVLMVNAATAEALGTTAQALVGTDVRRFIPDERRTAFEGYMEQVCRIGESEGTFEVQRLDGSRRHWRYGNRLAQVDADNRYVIAHAVDVTAQHEQAATLRERSERDALTGAWNRRYLEEFEQRNGPDAHWAVVNVDLDHFKQVNDRLGHEAGDRVLVGVTAFLQQRVRDSDAVVRAGGDEFLLLLPSIDAHALDALVARLQRDMHDSPCALSLGWALREGQEALADTLARADLAMYERRQRARAGRDAH